MRRILVGFDGGDESRDALHLAKALAELEGAQLDVAAVFLHPPLAPRAAADPDQEAEYFEWVFSEARSEVPGTRISPRELKLSDISPARALNNLAEDEGVDLIAVGSTHRGPVGRVLPGSVGEQLLQGAPCAVAIAPRGFARREHFGLGLVGVAYDGTTESELALERAKELAVALDGELRIITVLKPLGPSPARGPHLEVVREQFQQVLESAVERIPDAVEVEPVLEQGEPAAVLARHGVDLDLLVIGSRGYGPVRRTLLGGVSAEVMRSAPCPVLVLPRGAGADSHRFGNRERPGELASSGG